MPVLSSAKLPNLTEYEGRAYLALLNHGVLTAEKISSVGNVPLPRVYDTMKSLLSKGMAMVSHTRPKTYRAQKPHVAIRNLVKSAKSSMEDAIIKLESDSRKILRELVTIKPSGHVRENSIWSLYSNGSLYSDKLNEAKEECLILGEAEIRNNLELLKMLCKKGVKIGVLLDNNSAKLAPLVRKSGAEVKLTKLGINGVIIDKKYAHIVHKTYEKLYDVLVVDHPTLVNCVREYFLTLWVSAGKVKHSSCVSPSRLVR